jgi:hypothetical protein
MGVTRFSFFIDVVVEAFFSEPLRGVRFSFIDVVVEAFASELLRGANFLYFLFF